MCETVQSMVEAVPAGYSTGIFREKKYGITKSIHGEGNSIKIFAEELGGNDFISMNFYRTEKGGFLKPCEMPEQKVLEFLQGVEWE